MFLFMFLFQGSYLLNHLQAESIYMHSMAVLKIWKIAVSRIIFFVFLEITVLFLKKKDFPAKTKRIFPSSSPFSALKSQTQRKP